MCISDTYVCLVYEVIFFVICGIRSCGLIRVFIELCLRKHLAKYSSVPEVFPEFESQ